MCRRSRRRLAKQKHVQLNVRVALIKRGNDRQTADVERVQQQGVSCVVSSWLSGDALVVKKPKTDGDVRA